MCTTISLSNALRFSGVMKREQFCPALFQLQIERELETWRSEAFHCQETMKEQNTRLLLLSMELPLWEGT